MVLSVGGLAARHRRARMRQEVGGYASGRAEEGEHAGLALGSAAWRPIRANGISANSIWHCGHRAVVPKGEDNHAMARKRVLAGEL